jgi:hypothetical protein
MGVGSGGKKQDANAIVMSAGSAERPELVRMGGIPEME